MVDRALAETWQQVFFWILAVVMVVAALRVVTTRNVIHAALYLVVTLLSVAGVFLLLGAEFLAWAQVLVYVGAVVVLILFGLMLTRAPIGPMAQENEIGPVLPLVVSGGLFGVLTFMIFQSFGGIVLPAEAPTFTRDLGRVIYVQWAFPFMTLGFLLTVALIGAIIMARREEGEGPLPPVEHRPTERPTPVPSDASSQPGVTRPREEEVSA